MTTDARRCAVAALFGLLAAAVWIGSCAGPLISMLSAFDLMLAAHAAVASP